jgi:RimJ/RimL family protein N-acetyltransferase
MIVFGNVEHAELIARRAGQGFDPMVDFVISRVRNSELLGGVIYTNYTGQSVQMHQAGFAPKWATPELMWCIYDFPFNYLKVKKIIATVPSPNRRALNITQKMGFYPVAVIPDVVPGGDMLVLSLSREDCKYLNLKSRFSAGLMENAA